MVYRTTANESTQNKKSPAEILYGRKLRTIHNSMLPPTLKHADASFRNEKKFDVGDPIYVRDYRGGHKPWNKGSISARRGRVMYDVKVGNELWTRHYNQLRPRNSNIPTSTQSSLPLDILLDTFNLPTTDKTEKQKCPAQTTSDKAEAANSTSRRSNRRRQQTERFQINPKKARY
nr:unnamed protein product [Trichobilharzia regenti]